jgi:hypothetical protein
MIREPNGVDFIIAPASYTDADRAGISAFLRKHKASKTEHREMTKSQFLKGYADSDSIYD